MKKLLLVAALFVATSTLSLSQHQLFTKPVPAKGYYKNLQAFSKQPRSPGEEIDKEKFPYDPVAAEKRLSLPPYYLENVTLNDIKIPDPPAMLRHQSKSTLSLT